MPSVEEPSEMGFAFQKAEAKRKEADRKEREQKSQEQKAQERLRSLRDIGRELGEVLGAEIREKLKASDFALTPAGMSPDQKLGKIAEDLKAKLDEAGVPSAMTETQKLMAQEMSQSKGGRVQVLRDVLDSIVGPVSDASDDVKALALEVIGAGPHLTLSFEQWAAVTTLVEQGIAVGRATR